jgi:hypothetical protein
VAPTPSHWLIPLRTPKLNPWSCGNPCKANKGSHIYQYYVFLWRDKHYIPYKCLYEWFPLWENVLLRTNSN